MRKGEKNPGDRLGQQIESECAAKAMAAGLDDTERRSAFNRQMMKTGWLSPDPASFGRKHGRKWLVTAYEAGDVVLHSAYMVEKLDSHPWPKLSIKM